MMYDRYGIPPHIIKKYGSAGAFKRAARRRLRELEKAYWRLQSGCAFFPCYEAMLEIRRQLDVLKEELSARKWGR